MAHKHGTAITLHWVEYPGDAAVDATTGAHSAAGTSKSCTTKAFLHYIQPATSGYRVHSEVESGDCLVDIVLGLNRVIDSGDTDLLIGQVVDDAELSAANRALTDFESPAIASELNLSSLDEVYAEINGERWVQKQVGQKLASAWDGVFSGIKFSKSLLLRKAV